MRDPMKYEGRDLDPDDDQPLTNGIEILVGLALLFVMAVVFVGSGIWAIFKAVQFAQGVFIP